MSEISEYLELHISKKLQSWVGVGTVIGAALFPFFGIADYFRPGDALRKFTIYRIIIVIVLLIIYLLNKLKRERTYQSILATTAVIAAAIINELMVLKLGGHASPYYVGLILIIIVGIGLSPISMPFSVFNAVAIYLIYIVPIFVFDRVTEIANFFASNLYILSTLSITITWRAISNKSMNNELTLQYELTQERNKLDQIVQVRTRDLQKSDQWHRSIFENSHDGIIILQKDGEIVNANNKACSMHGFAKELLIGTNIRLLIADNDKSKIKELMQDVLSGNAVVFEADYYNKKGSRIALETGAQLIPIGEEHYILMVNRDISEKKMIQAQLFEAQKMESISTLAGGIAHDFRNMITAVLGYAELVKYEKSISQKLRDRTDIIRNSAHNAGKTVSHLLSFARKNKYEMSPRNLNDVVQDTVKLMEMALPDNLHVDVRLHHDELTVQANVASIENVIMNLITNAKDAMMPGGTISIETDRFAVSGKVDIKLKKIPDGEYAIFKIKDTGSGIHKEILHRIFEPFYTTKERGKGTGLGLAMVYGVIADHRGYITIDTEIGSGSTFTLYFPIMSDRAESRIDDITQRAFSSAEAAKGSILLLDDDQAVLTILQDTLEARGYTVIAVENPISAIDRFRERMHDIKLVVTDISMPLMDGFEFIRQIKLMKPGIPVIAISAAAQNTEDSNAGVNCSLVKPFAPGQLEAAVRLIISS